MKLLPDVIWLAIDPIDMRTGADGLSLHVQQTPGRAPCDGTAYVFSNRRRTRLKVACWDGIGVWMCLRRLRHGQFIWPQADDICWQVSAEQWQWLVIGVDWQRLSAPALTDIDPAMLAQVRALFEQQQAALGQQQAALDQQPATMVRKDVLLAEKDFKILALTQRWRITAIFAMARSARR